MRSCRSTLNTDQQTARVRRGISTLWVLLTAPAIFIFFAVAVDVARLWHARSELKAALDAAALSGVKSWAEGGNSIANRAAARDAALVAADANQVVGIDGNNPSFAVDVPLDRNETVGGDSNDNTSPDGEVVLGAVTTNGGGANYRFCSNLMPASTEEYGILAQKTIDVYSIWTGLFGVTVGPYSVRCSTAARYEVCNPRLVHLNEVSSACP
ncbi:hypothetical protein GC176_05715 [bacterium]|nr:hypothetical protein [bacterium]